MGIFEQSSPPAIARCALLSAAGGASPSGFCPELPHSGVLPARCWAGERVEPASPGKPAVQLDEQGMLTVQLRECFRAHGCMHAACAAGGGGAYTTTGRLANQHSSHPSPLHASICAQARSNAAPTTSNTS